jgi:nitroreductase
MLPGVQHNPKLADARYPIHELLRKRWSPRAFADRTVDAETLRTLFEAARWAPSSSNEQPWRFMVGTKKDPAVYDRLLSCLVEANALWARPAPVLVLSIAKLFFENSGKPNRHAFYDVGMAVENLVIQATALGVMAHQMAGFHVEKARELFGIPQGYEPCTMIALGYLGDPDSLPEPLRAREVLPRSRQPLEKFVFGERWGEPSPMVTAAQ